MHEHMRDELRRNKTFAGWIIQTQPLGDVHSKCGTEANHPHEEQAIDNE